MSPFFTIRFFIKTLLISITLTIAAAACGPVSGITHIVRAKVDLDLAKTAGAQDHAIYEYEIAHQYLQKAKEEYGYSDFLAADEYAIKAENFAKKARERAEAAAQIP